MSCLRRAGRAAAALALAASWSCTIDFDAIQAPDASGMGDAATIDEPEGGMPPDASVDPGDDAGPDAAEPPPPFECVEEIVDEGSVRANTEDRDDGFSLSCGAGTGNDIAFEFRASRSDYYTFDTTGSSIDTVLGVLDGACDGAELACNDNAAGTLQSDVIPFLEAGQRVVAVVDGNTGEAGDVTLNVERVTCPGLDLTDQPLPTTKETSGGPGDHTGACGGDTEPERSFRFEPDADGLYRISASSEAFAPAVYLEDGPRCGGAELGCGFSRSAGAYPAEVTRFLSAGEPVTILVDGRDGSGLFDLDIEKLDESRSCPTESTDVGGVGGGFIVSGTLPRSSEGSTDHTLSGSCSASGGANFGTPVPLTDHSYPLTFEPMGDSVSCTWKVLSETPLAVYILEGADCSASEHLCATSEDQGAGMSPRYEASFSLNSSQRGDYVLVVESLDPMIDVMYSIEVGCVA